MFVYVHRFMALCGSLQTCCIQRQEHHVNSVSLYERRHFMERLSPQGLTSPLTALHDFDTHVIYICGRLNRGVADRQDGIRGSDGVPPRVPTDLSLNGHGESFLLNVVLKDRIHEERDKLTSESVRGEAVVDYRRKSRPPQVSWTVMVQHTLISLDKDVRQLISPH